MSKQHELILATNRWALTNIKQTAKKTVLFAGGDTIDIPKDKLVLLRDHPEGRHKNQEYYKSELFIIVLKHEEPSVYTIHPMCVAPVHTVNQWQLFDLKKLSPQDSGDTDPSDSSP